MDPTRAARTAPPYRSELRRFLRAWAAHPLRVSAVAPSSTTLADLITREVRPHGLPVVELGPGTGVFTRALIRRGIPERDLVLIEAGTDFAATLTARYPAARMHCMDARQLGALPDLEVGTVMSMISGLPLVSMPAPSVREIVAATSRLLATDGALYQFTYRPICPIPQRVLDEYGMRATLLGTTVRNIPPAAVYRIQHALPPVTSP